FSLLLLRLPRSTLFPYTTLFRSFCPSQIGCPVLFSKLFHLVRSTPFRIDQGYIPCFLGGIPVVFRERHHLPKRFPFQKILALRYPGFIPLAIENNIGHPPFSTLPKNCRAIDHGPFPWSG